MLTIAIGLFLFLFGLLIGSFLNVVAIRVLKRESIAYPPSHCVHCNHRLHAKDLAPVFSYVWLKGRCRYCRERISGRYPAGEMAAGLLFVLAYAVVGWRAELIVALFFISILIVVTQTDLEAMRIPNAVVIAGVIGGLALRLWTHPLPLWQHFAGMLAGSGLLLLIGMVGSWILKRETMGGGDIKLYLFIGLVLGLKLAIFSLFAASVVGLIVGLVQRSRGRQGKYAEMPFGPSIAAGALFVYLWGETVLSWYLVQY